jgi:hypothetical protein
LPLWSAAKVAHTTLSLFNHDHLHPTHDPGFQPNEPTVEPSEPNNGQSTFYELHPHTE